MKFDHSRRGSAVPVWKRAMDVSLVLLTLPLSLALGLLIALVIRSVSSGPILFRQARIGRKGKPFMLLKFRTMKVGAQAVDHREHLDHLITSNLPMVKMDQRGDSRIIPFGWWLRAAGLDELPQLLNVLRGEMSLVGPRPCLPYELRQYSPAQRERFDCLPGLTGLWQVCGKNNTTFAEMIRLDIAYARHQSLSLDLAIMVRTLSTLKTQVLESWHSRRAARVPAPLEPRVMPGRWVNK